MHEKHQHSGSGNNNHYFFYFIIHYARDNNNNSSIWLGCWHCLLAQSFNVCSCRTNGATRGI